MYHTFPAVLLTVLLLCASPLLGQANCSEEDPFLVPPSRTYCVDSNGVAVIAFTLRNFGAPGNYLVNFPDGSDTTYSGIASEVVIERRLLFACGTPPGNPQLPVPGSPFYDYRGQLDITRTDCVDDRGDPRRGSYDFNIVPNPILDIRSSGPSCSSPPFRVDLTAELCSEELVDTYTWYVNDNLVPGEQGPELLNYVFNRAGTQRLRLEVTTKACGSYSFDREIVISALPLIELNYQVDSSQLCSPDVTVATQVTVENATAVRWSSSSPDVVFSNPNAVNPVITIANTQPKAHPILVSASNPSCPTVEERFTITTFSGQTIDTPEPIRACAGFALTLCDQLTYAPPPESIRWSGSSPSVNLTDEDTTCPELSFSQPGNYVLTATGTDVCGLRFAIDVPVFVREGAPLQIDISAVDTLCASQDALSILDYVNPPGNVSSITGSGVVAATFDPAGLSGNIAVQLTDSCGTVYPLNFYVKEPGTASLPDRTVCSGLSVDLDTGAPGTYRGTGVTNNRFESTGLPAGDYRIDYVGEAFCGSVGAFTITVVDFPIAAFSIKADSCAGGSAGARYPTDLPLHLQSGTTAAVSCYTVLETGEAICGQDTAVFTFPTPGTYTLQQVVRAAQGGCTDTLERRVEILGDINPRFAVRIDSSNCDSLGLAFTSLSGGSSLDYDWVFSSGDTSVEANPVLMLARPFEATVLEAVVQSTNSCFTQVDTLAFALPRRFEVSFGLLNDNHTICSGDTAYLINSSVNATRYRVTFPNGRQTAELPATLVIRNPSDTTLKYPIRLEGFRMGCADQSVSDTLYILPVSTEAAFSLAYDDTCSPAELQLIDYSTPGSKVTIFWGDGSTPQLATAGDTLSHQYQVLQDTVFRIVLEAALCGKDTFENEYLVRVGAEAGFAVAEDVAACVEDSLSFQPAFATDGYSLEWTFGDGGSSLLSQPVYQYKLPGTYRVYLQTTNAGGCPARDSLEVVVGGYNGPPLEVVVPAATCVNAFFPIGVSGFSGNISYDYGNQLLAEWPIARPYQEEGEYLLSITATAANGCRTDTSRLVTVYPEFTVAITPAAMDTTIELGSELALSFQMEPLRKLDSIRWLGDAVDSYNTQQTTVAPIEDGYYRLQVTDQYGCFATDSLRVAVAKNYAQRVYVPNVFSPNGDGRNETFGVEVAPNTVEAIRSFRIMNRWGTMVYGCTDCPVGTVGSGWDGTVGGKPVEETVYLWIAEVEFRDGYRTRFTGDVTVIR